MRAYKYKNKRNKRLSMYRDLKKEKRKDFVDDLIWASVIVLFLCAVMLIMAKG